MTKGTSLDTKLRLHTASALLAAQHQFCRIFGKGRGATHAGSQLVSAAAALEMEHQGVDVGPTWRHATAIATRGLAKTRRRLQGRRRTLCSTGTTEKRCGTT